MNIETCTSCPDDLLEPYRPQGDHVHWTTVISGFWAQDVYHSGHIAYDLAKTDNNVWLLDSVVRNAVLDDVTEEDLEAGSLNDDQIQALWGTTLEEAQAWTYKRIVAVCSDAPVEANERFMAQALYQAVKNAKGRTVREPDDDWDDPFGILELGDTRPEMNEPSLAARHLPVTCNYAIDVAPLMPSLPPILRPHGWAFWIGFQWQPTVGRWMAHCGRRNEFKLISPELLKSLIREAREKQFVVTSYNLGKP